MKQIQETSFKIVKEALKQRKALNKDSSLYNFSQQLDGNNLLVLSGRFLFFLCY